jgi:hypothetical protein
VSLLLVDRDLGRTVTATVVVGAGLGFFTVTLTVVVAVAMTVTVLPPSGTALELEPAPKIAPITKMTMLTMHAPITMPCLDADQSPPVGGGGWRGICPISDRSSNT